MPQEIVRRAMLKNLARLSLVVYYGLAVHLPSMSSCKTCVRLRSLLIKNIFAFVGENCNVAKGVRFGRGSKISIGNNSGIGEKSFLVAMDEITIGDNVMIAPEVMILTGGHDYTDPLKTLIAQRRVVGRVVIGDDCWIGARAIILPGVVIADRVIIGAGSVVVKSISNSGIYAGNPAVKIKDIPK